MKITNCIVDRRVRPTHSAGTMVRRERKGVISGPYVVSKENFDTPLLQDGYVHGGVRMFLVDLAYGYRASIEDGDVLFEVKAELILRD